MKTVFIIFSILLLSLNLVQGKRDLLQRGGKRPKRPKAPVTPQPTTTTTSEPTPSPVTTTTTPAPTNRPTNDPTNRPTSDPTNRPSGNPTPSPVEPTDEPTPAPVPTKEPTNNPTNRPTNNPTDRPSNNPTSRPTNDPTNKPTVDPTNRPSNNPSERPTNPPVPTPQPTTLDPTPSPTTPQPTTADPTQNTLFPSNNPSKRPTNNPSNDPTNRPTINPTNRPTSDPTRRPTNDPTNRPTNNPSNRPTNDPTRRPTDDPTNRPSSNPSNRPTDEPTAAQQCLGNPPELIWTQNSNGIYEGTMTYQVTSHNVGIASFRVRSHGTIPSPTLKFKRGGTYELRLINNLGPESPNNPTADNTFKDSNSTNIHTHGLHLSGHGIADNIFNYVSGGESMLYQFNIPCNHAAGTHLYHPHHHGSTTLQVTSGATGMIKVEEDPLNSEGLPQWLLTINNDNPLDIIFQAFDFNYINQNIPTNIDDITQNTGTAQFYLVNGEYQPTICLESGKYKRLNMLHIHPRNSLTLSITNSNNCNLYLLSRDGVLVHGENNETPRLITDVFFTVAGRNDIILACEPGDYTITANGNTMAFIHVSGNIPRSQITNVPSVFNPIRPPYLQSLLSSTAQETAIINFQAGGGGFRVNNQPFSHDENDRIFDATADTIQRWTINNGNHPYHQHLYHFQLLQNGFGNDLRGDWLDVLQNRFDMDIMFKTDLLGGNMVLHCHILDHEDRGLMAKVHINGGCDYDWSNLPGGPTCSYQNQCPI